LNSDLLRYLEIFTRFLTIYAIKLKAFKIIRSFNFDATHRMIKLEMKEQRKYGMKERIRRNTINMQRNIPKSIVYF
jgi:hypothetical protein